MKNNYKSQIIKLLESVNSEKHLRYLYILISQMASAK